MSRLLAISILLCSLPRAGAAQEFSLGVSSSTERLKDALKQASDRLGEGAKAVFDGNGARAGFMVAIGHASARPQAPPVKPAPPRLVPELRPQTPPPLPAVPKSVAVRSGDTLTAIAARNGVSLGALLLANPQIQNPNLIHPGQVVNLHPEPGAAPPRPTAGGSYRVFPGDTLSGIAARSGVSAQAIARANGIANPNLIYTGQTIRIPVAGEAPRSSAPERPAPAVHADGNARVAATAEQWAAQPHINPDTGNRNWSGWCLGFVNQVSRAATGSPDPGLQQPYARASYHSMESRGRISRNFSEMPAGAAVYWTSGQYGHVAIFSGNYTPSGDPLIVTTGFGTTNAREVPLSRINAALGPSAGYAAL